MAGDQKVVDTSLKVEKEFQAPVESVYRAWADPEEMVRWMGPGEVKCKNVDIDLKVGGSYRIHMVSSEGDHIAVGTYREIVPNKRLQFTWNWQGGDMPETLVTVEFASSGEATRLILIHENFPAKEAAQKHSEGWGGCLAGLEAFLKQ